MRRDDPAIIAPHHLLDLERDDPRLTNRFTIVRRSQRSTDELPPDRGHTITRDPHPKLPYGSAQPDARLTLFLKMCGTFVRQSARLESPRFRHLWPLQRRACATPLTNSPVRLSLKTF
jgi:hypothetical protein